MAIKKDLTEDSCTACGLCDEFCYELSKLNDEATMIDEVNHVEYGTKIKGKEENSPVIAVKIFEYEI